MRILFACAGTGGHILPAVILARGLLRRSGDMEVMFCLSDDQRGRNMLDREGLPWCAIPVRPFPRRLRLQGLLFPFSIIKGLFRSLSVVRRFRPQVVVGTGGYVSGPVLLAAWIRRIPVMIQEQNIMPGLANRLLAPLVDEIHVSFPEALKLAGAGRKKVYLTGNPVAFNGNGNGGVNVSRRERPGEPPVILVMGGSQGAHPINRIVVRYLHTFDRLPYRVYFQTGDSDYSWVNAALKEKHPLPVISPFFTDLSSIYREVDLAICRAGAMTLSELAFWGIPSVLIPYPYATGGHQERNALSFERAGAAIVLGEREADGGSLRRIVDKVFGERGRWKSMSRAAFSLGRPGARDELVNRIIALGR
jgi:UDP-N-acetylglucosamine--N-acetylmuramyl-(pentapeptide) pyrophosphoryl-undecaprenol N-acetylglucosamine transferase